MDAMSSETASRDQRFPTWASGFAQSGAGQTTVQYNMMSCHAKITMIVVTIGERLSRASRQQIVVILV